MSIRSYWINELHDVEEFKAIANAVDPEIAELNKEAADLLKDQFIKTSTLKGIVRREKILKIQPFYDDTLETRRFRISVRWNNSLPYTFTMSRNKLVNMIGEDGFIMTRNLEERTLEVRINLGMKRMLQDALKMVRNISPCNLVITVDLQYNRHIDLARFSHNYLSSKTYRQLREEVLE